MMMKKLFMAFAVAMLSLTANAQDIFGTWVTGDGDGNVEIYESNGKVYGKVVWLAKGPDTRDTHNPHTRTYMRARARTVSWWA